MCLYGEYLSIVCMYNGQIIVVMVITYQVNEQHRGMTLDFLKFLILLLIFLSFFVDVFGSLKLRKNFFLMECM